LCFVRISKVSFLDFRSRMMWQRSKKSGWGKTNA
jgi:hypothetical protein